MFRKLIPFEFFYKVFFYYLNLKTNNLNGKKNYGIILKLTTAECVNNYTKINEQEENENNGLDFMD